MNGTFDVFLRKDDSSLVWIGVTETLALAREEVVQSPDSIDHAFLIVNSASGEETLIEPAERPPLGFSSC